MNSTILVIGATGNIGKELVKLLANNGHAVRATVRPTTRIEELKSLGVEMVEADLQDSSTLKAAMNGADKVFFRDTSGFEHGGVILQHYSNCKRIRCETSG